MSQDSGWRHVAMRRLVELNPPVPEFLAASDEDEITFLPLEAVWPGSGLDIGRRRPKREVDSGYTRFREGDLLLPKITPTFEADRSTIARGLRNGFGAGTTELHVLRSRPGVEARYVDYLVSSRPFLTEGAASLVGVAGQKRVPETFILSHVVWLPTLDAQRRIADHLDAETARIDALIAMRQRQIELLGERLEATNFERVPWGEGELALRQAGTKVFTGPFGTQLAASEYVLDGIPLVNPSHIRAGLICPEDGVAVSGATATRLARHQLMPGDIVMGRKGDVGRSALVTDREKGWLCGSDSIAIRCATKCLLPEYLVELLHLSWTRQQLASRSTGATLGNVNEQTLLSLRLPVPNLETQTDVCHSARQQHAERGQTRVLLNRQIGLLRERRQAMITAAVTGELVVS